MPLLSEQKREDLRYKERKEDAERNTQIARNDDDAQGRYQQYWTEDPYPKIWPALLNSADIFKYVQKTGMIFPFYPEKLSGASYEVAIGGKVIWWDEKEGKQHEKDISKPGSFFELKPNSIAFVTLEPMFRIPDYIALRFNLKIMHVYKGLLLGTGPIVDPGFEGHLSIPLHNLTANTYIFHKGDGIIELEFTKLSPNHAWLKELDASDGLYKRQWMKKDRSIQDYLSKALGQSNNTVVRSSIPDELKKVRDIAKKTKHNARKIQKKQDKKINGMQISTVLITIPVLVFACTAVYQIGSMAKDSVSSKYESIKKEYDELDTQAEQLKDTLAEKIAEFEKLNAQTKQLEKKISEYEDLNIQNRELTERITKLESELNESRK